MFKALCLSPAGSVPGLAELAFLLKRFEYRGLVSRSAPSSVARRLVLDSASSADFSGRSEGSHSTTWV